MTDKTASYFLANKLSVFECQSNRKPKEAGWRDLEYWMIDGEEADSWKCYGIPIESEWLVIDVDLRKPEAHDSFARLSAFVDFSDTFRCKTARGGWHYWFKNPTNQPIRKNVHCQSKDCKNKDHYHGIDFLSDGCYVVGPSSVADTGTYTYIDGELTETREASTALLELLTKVEHTASREVISGVQTSLEFTRYKQWIDAQPPAISGENGNDYTYNILAYGFDFGLDKEDIFAACLNWNDNCSPPWSVDELRALIANAGKYAQNAKGKAAIQFEAFTAAEPSGNFPDSLPAKYIDTKYGDEFYETLHPGVGLTTRGDKIEATSTNLRLILLSERYKGLFSYNKFRTRIALNRVPPWRGDNTNESLEMKETDWCELRVDMAIQARLEVPSYLLEDSVTAIALARSFHPICDWLSSLKWDGGSRFHKLFGGNSYQLNVAKVFLLASIYRIFQPGYKFDHMLVIAGAQGIGKSYLVQTLGGEFTTTMQHMPTDRKGLQELNGAWWIELPELSAVKRADINQIKAFITSTKDTYIPMYGRGGPQDFPRICVPVWTLNPTEVGFITDDVNRRFLIIEQKNRIDIDYIKENRDQIFAEAMELYRKGVQPHHIVETLKDQAEEIAQANKQEDYDPWGEVIENWIASTKASKIYNKIIFTEVLGYYRAADWDKKAQVRIGKIFKKLGLVRKKANGETFYVKNDEESIDSEFEV